jgi:hypothetical protein
MNDRIKHYQDFRDSLALKRVKPIIDEENDDELEEDDTDEDNEPPEPGLI